MFKGGANMNNNQFQGLSKVINQAIDAYDDLIYQLEHRESKTKKKRDFSKIKDFLFKKVF